MIDIDLEAKRVYFRKVQKQKDYYSQRIQEDESQPVIVGEIISAHRCRCGKVVHLQALTQGNIGNVEDYKGSGEHLEGITVEGGVVLMDQEHYNCKFGKIYFDFQDLIQYCWAKIYTMGTYINEEEIPILDVMDLEVFEKIKGILKIEDLIGNGPAVWLFDSEAFLKKFYKTNYWTTDKEREKAKKEFKSLLVFKKIEAKITVIDDIEKLKRNPKTKPIVENTQICKSVNFTLDRVVSEPVWIEQMELF